MSNITTITPIAEVRIPVKLDRERDLVFDMNTMALFENETKKFYWDTLMSLFDLQQTAIDKARVKFKADFPGVSVPEKLPYDYVDMLRGFPMSDFRALLRSACHEYDKDGNIIQPLSLVQIGRCLRPLDAITMVVAILRGHAENSPTREEVGEASAPAAEASAGAEKPADDNGGEASIASLEGAFV